MEFDELYQEIILDHYKNPRNFGETCPHCASVELDNPVCGDHVELHLLVNPRGEVEKITFSGSGCAISMASASMMTEVVKGKTLPEVKRIIRDVLAVLRGEKDAAVLEEYGDLTALQGVSQYPVRIKCATLAWHALEDALQRASEQNNA